MDGNFVLMISNVHAVGGRVIGSAEATVGEMGLEGGAVAIEAGDGGAQAGGGWAPSQGWAELGRAGDGLCQ